MSKVSKANADQHWSVPGMMDAVTSEVDGYSVEMESWDIDMDFAFTFKGLPDDRCTASHVGYIIEGAVTIGLADGTEEVYEAGDAIILRPGHVASVAAGTKFVMFTPIEEAKAIAPVIQANMMKWAAEHGIEV